MQRKAVRILSTLTQQNMMKSLIHILQILVYDKFNAIDMLMGRKERILMNFENQLEAIERVCRSSLLDASINSLDEIIEVESNALRKICLWC